VYEIPLSSTENAFDLYNRRLLSFRSFVQNAYGVMFVRNAHGLIPTKMHAVLCVSPASANCLCMAAQAPQAQLKSGPISATVYLPDAKQGFYRTTRSTGLARSQICKVDGHHIYTFWFNRVDPAALNHGFGRHSTAC
jgi:hypothetical protein